MEQNEDMKNYRTKADATGVRPIKLEDNTDILERKDERLREMGVHEEFKNRCEGNLHCLGYPFERTPRTGIRVDYITLPCIHSRGKSYKMKLSS